MSEAEGGQDSVPTIMLRMELGDSKGSESGGGSQADLGAKSSTGKVAEDGRKRSELGEDYFSASSSSKTHDFTESAISSSSSNMSQSYLDIKRAGEATVKASVEEEQQKQRQHQKTYMHHMKQQGNSAGYHVGISSYDELLTQFGELQKDMTRTLSVCQKLRTENDGLMVHNDRLRGEHLQLRTKYLQARKQLVEETETRLTAEQRQEDLIVQWQRKLETKAKEFADFQVQMAPPRDLNQLRSKIKDELERPHRVALDNKDAEIEILRAKYSEERGEHKLIETEFEQYTISQRKDMDSLKAAHAAEVSELRSQLDLVTREAEDTGRQEQHRLRGLELEQVRAERDHLSDQLNALLKSVEDLKIKLDQQEIVHARESAELRNECKELHANMISFRKKEEFHQSEKRRLQDLLDTSNGKVIQHQADMSKLRAKVFAGEKAIEEERARSGREMIEITSKTDRERHELRAALDTLERKLTLQTSKHAEENKLRDNQHSAAIAELERTKERLEKSLENSNKSKERTKKELEETRLRLESQAREHVEIVDRLRAQCDSHAADARRATKEKDVLHEKTKNLGEQLRQTRQRADQYQTQAAELEKEYRVVQEKHRDALTTEATLRGKLDRLESQREALEGELGTLQTEKVKQQHKIEELALVNDTIKSEAEEKENTLKTQMARTLINHTQDEKYTKEKLEKKQVSYHNALTKCKKRIRELASKSLSLQQELKTQQQMFRTQEESFLRRIKELERERELYRHEKNMLRSSFGTHGDVTLGLDEDIDNPNF
mmetsp:Transcript_19299/g.32278  ORF Transcript_19299/g.32278 Transcript_19299/m.32278 type:complete len:781 (-) Transcript_19299:1032-3374(-)|eukprot:CAMPEP_0203758592 /NCGR_PEP_ID=MMETSP0098-20131031/11448_1 /ASSEMBLY_ACC=CAM_ASM_000208 /TAXON_ID=96639 /ORGANISM=" , Strain NY0313808BC1" /LENGTH=780 /DNA_ID=CAMNT_0050651111 /DNA_START=344 /DNA_END=2686 /DNA_ORIENTATION=+